MEYSMSDFARLLLVHHWLVRRTQLCIPISSTTPSRLSSNPETTIRCSGRVIMNSTAVLRYPRPLGL